MKKFIIALTILCTISIACKKENIGGGGLCACSPIEMPYLSLVLKNSNNEDLLDTKTNGAFTKDKIQLFYKESNGAVKQIDFAIRQPFSYGSDQYKYFQLYSLEIAALAKSIDHSFYLKLGQDKVYELNLKVNNTKLEKLLIEKQEALFEHPSNTTYGYVNSIFLLKI